jgi:hypothetical protein
VWEKISTLLVAEGDFLKLIFEPTEKFTPMYRKVGAQLTVVPSSV